MGQAQRAVWRVFLLGAALLPAAVGAAEAPPVAAYTGTLDIPTYPWMPPVPHPYFRATDQKNIYPYPMLDNLARTKTPRVWKTVVLENEYLRVTFLPELGGKIFDVFDKTAGAPVFYVNRVVKPGLIGQCGAWVAGGIEFNTGPAGHTVSAVQPVDVQILPPEPDGARSVAVGEVERIYRTRWTVIVTLRPGRAFLEERIRFYNRTETVRPYYFWNCAAVPNTPGFRFVYPMTLGTDHAGTTFYTWPISEGRDLSLGRTYEDASSIFAYRCDQDFFGAYDEEADRGIVAYSDHRLVPGKKAWTWGHGGYGAMHQMDLTDDDGPYNEIQTGPLPTQVDVGRLDPHEVATWREWWYPVRGLGGFTHANRDVAVNASRAGGKLRLRILGTGTWEQAEVRAADGARTLAKAACAITPRAPVEVALEIGEAPERVTVFIEPHLARLQVPLDLPVRTRPARAPALAGAGACARAGWQEYLRAQFPEAEKSFARALELDGTSVEALTGLACLALDRDAAAAAAHARAALAVDPDHGLAAYACAAARLRLGDEAAALDEAWQAALDPLTAAPARALAAKILIRRGEFDAVIDILGAEGPWRGDPAARNRLAFACLRKGRTGEAVAAARRNLGADPLDAFARSVLWLGGAEREGLELGRLIGGNVEAVLELAAEYMDLGQPAIALDVIENFEPEGEGGGMLMAYTAGYLAQLLGRDSAARDRLAAARRASPAGVFPHRIETEPVLRWALARDERDGAAALLLGHLLFSLGRHDEGRAFWKRAAENGAAPSIAYRALGLASLALDGDRAAARAYLERGCRADPADAILAMDLARVLMAQAERESSAEARKAALEGARDALAPAAAAGRGRSDFVALLARAHERLGDHARAAALLDSVRITIWEGAREAHDLYEKAHLALGGAHLAAGRAAEALAEFDLALLYPANLATGRFKDAREAHIHYRRGQALAALGRTAEARAAWRQAAEEPASDDPRKEEARAKAAEALAR